MMVAGLAGLSGHSPISIAPPVFTPPIVCGWDEADHHTVLITYHYLDHYLHIYGCYMENTTLGTVYLYVKSFSGLCCNPGVSKVWPAGQLQSLVHF